MAPSLDDLVIGPIPKERQQEFIDFVYKEFFPRERLAIASGLDKNTNPGTIDTFLEWLKQDLSLAFVDRKSNRIVGIALNCLLEKSNETLMDFSCLATEDRVIWSFLEHLEEDYNAFEKLGVERGMELVFLCVSEEFLGLGLARLLTEETIALARRNKLPFIKSNPTTPATHHIFKSVGFQKICQMSLKDFNLDGKPGFPYAEQDDIVGLCILPLL